MIHISSGARVGDPLLPLARARADSSLAQLGSVQFHVRSIFLLNWRDGFSATHSVPSAVHSVPSFSPRFSAMIRLSTDVMR
jgi:hypothetical protein